jgi:glycosyltransferase involved in cell wall biosynthesis
LPSVYEPFGAVVNEALIFGLKVLCSQYAGASYLVQDNNGEIFNPLEEEDTLKKLKIFLDSIKLVEEIDLKKNPSLMSDYQQNYIKEWGKLICD